MDHIGNALAMAEAAAADPSKAPDHVRRIANALRMAKDDTADALGPLGQGTHIIDVDSITSIAATGAEVGPFRWDWPGGAGDVLGFFMGTLDGDPKTLSSIKVRISIEGEREVVSNGGGVGYAALIAFRGGLSGDDVPWAKLRKFTVTSGTRWALYFKNFGPNPVTPFVHILYRASRSAG